MTNWGFNIRVVIATASPSELVSPVMVQISDTREERLLSHPDPAPANAAVGTAMRFFSFEAEKTRALPASAKG
jgi:hypothetical protein